MKIQELESFLLRKADYNEILAYLNKYIHTATMKYFNEGDKYSDILAEETVLRQQMIEGTLGFYALSQSLEEEVYIYIRSYKKLMKALKRTRQKHPYTILKEPDTIINYLEENFSLIIEQQKKI